MQDNQKRKIVAIVGMSGSGKSTVREIFEKHGFVNIYFGGIVLEETERRGLELTEANERPVREELRAKEGMGVMAKRSIPKIEELISQDKHVVIDDLYSFSELMILREKYGEQFVVVAVSAPRKYRYERLKIRKLRPRTEEESESRDIAEIENLEKGGPIAMADYTLLNDNSIEDFRAKAENLIKEKFI